MADAAVAAPSTPTDVPDSAPVDVDAGTDLDSFDAGAFEPLEGDAPDSLSADPGADGDDAAGDAKPLTLPSGPVGVNELGAIGEVKVKQKVNGKDIELSVKEWIDSGGRLGQAAFAKFREAKQMRDDAEGKIGQMRGLIQDAKTNPLSFVRQLGAEAEEALYASLREEFRRQSLPEPERKALDVEERERRLAEQEARLREAEERRKAEEAEAEIGRHAMDFRRKAEAVMTQAMDAASFSSDREDRVECIERAASHLAQFRAENPRQPITAAVVAEAAKRAMADIDRIAQRYAKRLDVDKLAELAGNEKMEALRKRDLERLRTQQQSTVTQPARPGTPAKLRPAQKPASMPDLDKITGPEWTRMLNEGMRRA
jgi:hypothetical protein